MELSPEQQEALNEQKKNCIFCQIVEGNIPSKKVYEDDLLIAILDINPAVKGHVLLMPKEHYPIMPLIPEKTFKQMVDKMKAVDESIKEALLCKETTILVANGAAAGQQSAHFMMHIIPRESGDELEMLDIAGEEAPDEDIKEVVQKAGPPLQAMLGRNLPMLGFIEAPAGGAGAGGGIPQNVTKDQLLQIIDSNPQVKELILSKPDQFKQMVPQHPQLSQLFSNVDIDEIIAEVARGGKPKKPGKLSMEDALK
ncbi:HIT family protein [Nanoarchaeota archaeon]